MYSSPAAVMQVAFVGSGVKVVVPKTNVILSSIEQILFFVQFIFGGFHFLSRI
jgi:hypothetical protein